MPSITTPRPRGFVEAATYALDWSNSPLGPPASWPDSLRFALSFVFGSAGPKVLLWGPELITFFNDAYLALSGAEVEAALGQPFPERRATVWRVVEPYYRAAFAGVGQFVQIEIDFGGDAGTRAYSVCYSPFFAAPDDVCAVIAEIHEITDDVARRQSLETENERFRALFEQAPVFMALGTAPDIRFQYVNRAFDALVGGRPLVGMTVAEALPEVEGQGMIAILQHVLATGEPFRGTDMPLQLRNRADGPLEQFHLDFIYQPIVDANQAVTGILCVGYDVSEQHLASERAQKLELDLQHALRMGAMGTMATTLAHELNQPLTAASNYLVGANRLVAAMHGPERDKAQGALREAEAQINRAGEIIRRIRGMVEGAGNRRQSVSLTTLIARSIKLFEATGGSAETKLTTDLGNAPAMVFVDPIQIEQVLLNLIRNACEAMIDAPRREIILASRSNEDGFVEIQVRDFGTGLPPNDVHLLFAAFGKAQGAGLGVGLSIARTIVEVHGGRIWARNNAEGGGASFHFTLPSAT